LYWLLSSVKHLSALHIESTSKAYNNQKIEDEGKDDCKQDNNP